jgi:hypothetical protein
MAKRKVIKFVFQGRRQVKSNEWYPFNDSFAQWKNVFESINDEDVYHRIETEEEVPRWRAQVGEVYYSASANLQVAQMHDTLNQTDNCLFDSGNYFQTEEQAQEYIDHCKKFFENN